MLYGRGGAPSPIPLCRVAEQRTRKYVWLALGGGCARSVICVPYFLAALRHLLDDLARGDCAWAAWSPSGREFWVRPDDADFRAALAALFRHSGHVTSFQRQLAAYGFRYHTDAAAACVVHHPLFLRDDAAAMADMRRAAQPRGGAEGAQGAQGGTPSKRARVAEGMLSLWAATLVSPPAAAGVDTPPLLSAASTVLLSLARRT